MNRTAENMTAAPGALHGALLLDDTATWLSLRLH